MRDVPGSHTFVSDAHYGARRGGRLRAFAARCSRFIEPLQPVDALHEADNFDENADVHGTPSAEDDRGVSTIC